ncbi:MAG: hydroxyacylglutathione hydrolase [Candidatus Lambdaproteobacteria bacterium]|nr:hydroxyacylglutathione hydrolase [Candidatus Lambdaproteobacteria bacterium]
MRIVPVPCLADNFAYLLICEETGQAGVVDPAEAEPVLHCVAQEGVTLSAILNTHHHWDHVGGNKALLARQPKLKVYGHASDRGRIEGQTELLEAGAHFSVGKLAVRALHNPGHTSGAVSYVVQDAVFTGDTMFAAGCGRLLEGTPENMYHSLCKVIGSLPPETRVFFGHEYTEKNLRFAAQVEPDNADVQDKLAAVRALRAQGQFTTPSTLAAEWKTNPFMRTDSKSIQQTVRQSDPGNDLTPIAVLGAIRRMKDQF